jgi:hypothetical protein
MHKRIQFRLDPRTWRSLCLFGMLPVVLGGLLDSVVYPARGLAALCDLSPLNLPAKDLGVPLDTQTVSVQVAVRLSFSPQGAVYSITETASAKFSAQSIGAYIQQEIGQPPDDQCGSIISILGNDVSATAGNLVINTNATARQWGCFIGVKALLAEGTIGFETTLSPSVTDNKVIFTPTVIQSGDLSSTIPDFDYELTNEVNSEIRAALGDALSVVNHAVEGMQAKLEAVETELKTSMEAFEPLYHPTISAIRFDVDGSDIVLIQTRNTQAREGTTCKLKEIAGLKWSQWN